jgi:NADP-dependent 3-hydroxy acid dehydrogenase YdfG
VEHERHLREARCRHYRRVVGNRRGDRSRTGPGRSPGRATCASRRPHPQARRGTWCYGALAIEADVTDRSSIVAAADQVRQVLGRADVLVNNAGVMLLGPFNSEQRADHRQMVEVNLLGAMTTTEVFLDQLRAGGGDLVNISSVAGRTARAGNAGYAATKWGMNGWSEALRQELQPDIRVTVIEPGAVATELTDHITHADTKRATEAFVKDLAIRPEDIAEIIAFVLSRPRRVALNEILVRPTAQAG